MANKKITVDLAIQKDGVPAPPRENVTFSVHQEVLDEDGIFNPVDGAGPFNGALQINIEADAQGWRELGRYLLGLAEYDVGGDPGFHQHHERLVSADGRTRLHVIVRKPLTQQP
jgi:hypothetical protein